MTDTQVPPAFPTVTMNTPDGSVTTICEPVGEHLALVPSFLMMESDGVFAASLTGAFDVVVRSNGMGLSTSAGCIACARSYASTLAALPVDWSATTAEIQEKVNELPPEQARELAGGADLQWGCDTEWCDGVGPGVVIVPID